MLFYISAEKSPNLRTNLIFLSWHICPGSESGFVSVHTDLVPDPTFIIQIRIHKSGSASLICPQIAQQCCCPTMRRRLLYTFLLFNANICPQMAVLLSYNKVDSCYNIYIIYLLFNANICRQMAVLLSYNEADSWTVANLVKATQIKEDLLVQVSLTFSYCVELGLLY